MNNKIRLKVIGIITSIFLIFSLVITFAVSSLNVKAMTNTENQNLLENNDSTGIEQDIEQDNFFIENDNSVKHVADTIVSTENEQSRSEAIISEFEEKAYLLNDIVTIQFKVDTLADIYEIKYNNDGFIIKNINTVNNVTNVSIKFKDNIDYAHFKLIAVLVDEDVLVSNIYGYKVEEAYYLSRASQADIFDLKYNDELINNQITLEEYNELLIKNTTVTSDIEMGVISEDLTNVNQNSTLAISSTTTVVGRWRWDDGTNKHPLKDTLVSLYIEWPFEFGQSCSNITQISTYTNEDGEYKFTFSADEEVEVYVQVYSEGENVLVKKNWLSTSYRTSTPSQTLSPGGTASFYYSLNNESTTFKAFQVCQALITGANYVQAMGKVAPDTTCYFPASSNTGGTSINITEEATGYWDIILHEYGHRLQYYYDITDSPGGEHDINEELIAVHGKDKGIRLAWGEGWPTFFSILVTQYYKSSLQNINYVGDNQYNSYSYDDNGMLYPWDYNLDDEDYYADGFGEGCEAAIFMVLYDLYDPYSTNEEWDNVSLSHKTMFEAVINSKATTFSEFYNYFIDNYSSIEIGNIGSILAEYGIASTYLRTYTTTLNPSVPPTFSWNAGGPTSSRFNSFQLIFYNSNNDTIFRTMRQTTTSFTLEAAQWGVIVEESGSTFSVAVISYQTDSPETGGYYSAKLTRNKPAA